MVVSFSSPAPVFTIVGVVSFSSSSPLADSSSFPSPLSVVVVFAIVVAVKRFGLTSWNNSENRRKKHKPVRREFPNGDEEDANGLVVFADPKRRCDDQEEVVEVEEVVEEDVPNAGLNEEREELEADEVEEAEEEEDENGEAERKDGVDEKGEEVVDVDVMVWEDDPPIW